MRVLEPAIHLVGRLSFRNKLRVTAGVFGIPLLIIAGSLFYTLNARVTALQLEREALALQVPAYSLLSSLYQHAATRQAVDAGAEHLATALQARQRDSLAALKQLQTSFDAHTLPLSTRDDKPPVLGNWEVISQNIANGDVAVLKDLIVSLRSEMDGLNETTGLLIDGDASNSRLLDIMTSHLPGLIVSTGQVAQAGTATLISKSLRGSRRNELTLQRGNFDAYVQWSIDALQKVISDHPGLAEDLNNVSGQLNTTFLSVQEAMTTKMLETSDFDMAPEVFLGLTAKAFENANMIGAILENNADILIANRLTGLQVQRNVVLLAMVVGIFLIAAGFLAAYISIMRGLNGLSDAVSTMAAGDLGARVEISTRDELGEVGSQFNQMAAKLAESTTLLHEKNAAIDAMLKNMPQGILTIVDDGKIHPEYSAFLESIFETDKVAGESAIELILGNGSVTADIQSQVEATLAASIGEDRMNFDFNSHLLVSKVFKTFPDGRVKSLELSWAPICDEHDVVEKVMVCVRDETELRELEAQSRHQKLELEMIGQILKINQEKFHEFVDGARVLAAENKQLLEGAKHMSAELVTQLFRNMHTIKGNARTYGLLVLTNVSHEAEQAYDELRKDDQALFDKCMLLGQLESVVQRLEEYAQLNDVTLGRKGPGRRGSADKFVMVERTQVTQMLANLDAYDLHAVTRDTLAAVVSQIKQDLRLVGTESVQNILDGVFSSLPSLAKELGKEPPNIVIADNGLRLHNQFADILRNVFMHLYRNSMDHGIESSDVRREQGKSLAGTIRLIVERHSDMVQFRLSDDGKGLALAHIRQKAIAKGLISHTRAMLDDEVAELIFAAGFSTASAVTEVSGRGVGMDAVKDFVTRAGGKIQLQLLDQNIGADFRMFETVISLPGQCAVDQMVVSVPSSILSGQEHIANIASSRYASSAGNALLPDPDCLAVT
jgi:two-component system chemotaxis sensor kinase CheA